MFHKFSRVNRYAIQYYKYNLCKLHISLNKVQISLCFSITNFFIFFHILIYLPSKNFV